MAVTSIKAVLPCEINKVWELVFGVENYGAWRSDLSKIEVVNNRQFIEYTKDGYSTKFTVTLVEPYARWEFEMENSNIEKNKVKIVLIWDEFSDFFRQNKNSLGEFQKIVSICEEKPFYFVVVTHPMTGHWIGVFTERGDETEIDFTECVKAKKWFMKPFIKSYLRKQQAQFVADIRKALGRM